MAAEIKRELGIDSEIVRGSGGIFEISVDNRKIYSKRETGQFPLEKDIVEKLRTMQ